ncbi:hypothetical protein [Saccharomonospora xinjiangensis]|uniref:Secreted protein n=1 Tax=Saccharomonospora xinjiangensis XJ-54 TaxID=882086 RepID=I0V8X9_9PSEU|nr:hypothetical protein [Saccharomonospora xinjiangensis]EID56582.1 hypothetical protein SacxiDRAFT_4403 [Saccharomonospora xinjiangensis XJ-54]
MLTKTTVRRVLGAAFAAMAFCAASAVTGQVPAAQAGDDGSVIYSSDNAGRAKFVSYGDKLCSWDAKADGRSAVALGKWWDPNSVRLPAYFYWKPVWNTKGAGTQWVCATYDRNGGAYTPEGMMVEYYACTGEYSEQDPEHCGRAGYGVT